MLEQGILRVLIVDDEPIVADTLGLIVRATGHTVRLAYSGEEATALARDFQPHVAISDVLMPGMDGFEFADWLEENQPECRVLLVSGHVDVINQECRTATGRPRLIRMKPLHPSEILRFIAAYTPEQPQPQ